LIKAIASEFTQTNAVTGVRIGFRICPNRQAATAAILERLN
jgi:hypothetical protein